MKKKLLIDADVIVYRFSHAHEKKIEFDEGDELYAPDLGYAIAEADDFIEGLLVKTKCEEFLLCLSHTKNFRKDIFPPYKANRKKLRKPSLLAPIRNYLKENYSFKIRERLEADDIMGIMGTRHPGRYILASIDKDFLQIPGDHYNWDKDKHFTVTEEEADYWHKVQTLIGDTVDNYKGVPGIGPVKAHKALEEDPSWDTVFGLFEAKGLTYEDALVQARLARILRDSDYDSEKKEPILWTPSDTG
jgi:DNA polymerase-1